MLITVFPFVVTIVGLLLWALSANALVRDAGRGSFFIGLFFVVGAMSKTTVNVGSALVAVVPFVVLISGLLVWALSQRAILKDIGRGSFFIGLFYVVSALSKFTMHLG